MTFPMENITNEHRGTLTWGLLALDTFPWRKGGNVAIQRPGPSHYHGSEITTQLSWQSLSLDSHNLAFINAVNIASQSQTSILTYRPHTHLCMIPRKPFHTRSFMSKTILAPPAIFQCLKLCYIAGGAGKTNRNS